MERHIFKTREVAKELLISLGMLYQYIHRGILTPPSYRFDGGMYLWTRPDIEVAKLQLEEWKIKREKRQGVVA